MILLLTILLTGADPAANYMLPAANDPWINLDTERFFYPSTSDEKKYTLPDVLGASLVMIKSETPVNGRTIMTIRVLTDQRWLPAWTRLLEEGLITMSGKWPESLSRGSLAYKSHGVIVFFRMDKRHYSLNTVERFPTGRWMLYSEYTRARAGLSGVLDNTFVPLQEPTAALIIEKNYESVVAGELKEQIRFGLLYQRPMLDTDMFNANQEYQKRRVLYEMPGQFDWSCQEGEDREHRNNTLVVHAGTAATRAGEDRDAANEVAWMEYMKLVRGNPPYSSDNHAKYCYSLRSGLIDHLIAVAKARRERGIMDRKIDLHRRDLQRILEGTE